MSIRVGSTDSKSRVKGRVRIYSTGVLCLTRSPPPSRLKPLKPLKPLNFQTQDRVERVQGSRAWVSLKPAPNRKGLGFRVGV